MVLYVPRNVVSALVASRDIQTAYLVYARINLQFRGTERERAREGGRERKPGVTHRPSVVVEIVPRVVMLMRIGLRSRFAPLEI